MTLNNAKRPIALALLLLLASCKQLAPYDQAPPTWSRDDLSSEAGAADGGILDLAGDGPDDGAGDPPPDGRSDMPPLLAVTDNLLLNGGCEEVSAVVVCTGAILSPKSWAVVDGPPSWGCCAYGPVPAQSGSTYFYAGYMPSHSTGAIAQEVGLDAHAALIDGGTAVLSASALFAFDAANVETGELSVELFTAANTSTTSWSSGEVQGNSTWKTRKGSFWVPPGTRRAVVTLRGTKLAGAGAYCDAFFDDVTLKLWRLSDG